MKPVNKGDYGYIDYRKKSQLVKSSIGIIIVFGLLLVGFFLFKTKTNYFTVLAVVGTLPTAKIIVSYAIICKYKSPDNSQALEIKNYAKKAYVLYDMVFTSKDKVMHAEYVIVSGNTVCAYSSEEKLDKTHFEKTLTEFLQNGGYKCNVKLLKDYQKFVQRLESMPDAEFTERQEGIIRSLLSLSV